MSGGTARRVGRPSETGVTRGFQMRVRLTDQEYGAVKRAAVERGYGDVAHYVRALLGLRGQARTGEPTREVGRGR